MYFVCKDGDLNGNCSATSERCVTENAECDSITVRCTCTTGYSGYEGTCVEGKIAVFFPATVNTDVIRWMR